MSGCDGGEAFRFRRNSSSTTKARLPSASPPTSHHGHAGSVVAVAGGAVSTFPLSLAVVADEVDTSGAACWAGSAMSGGSVASARGATVRTSPGVAAGAIVWRGAGRGVCCGVCLGVCLRAGAGVVRTVGAMVWPRAGRGVVGTGLATGRVGRGMGAGVVVVALGCGGSRSMGPVTSCVGVGVGSGWRSNPVSGGVAESGVAIAMNRKRETGVRMVRGVRDGCG